MNSIHDMGGMHGFGAIEYEEDEPVFHHIWEGRVYGIVFGDEVPYSGNLRYDIERIPPATYLRFSYYEKWLLCKIQDAIIRGSFTQEEFDAAVAYYRANPQAEPPRRADPEAAARVVADIFAPYSHRHVAGGQPTFQIGDNVLIKNFHPAGHTRLPRYARGKRAVIVKYYGVQDFDDGLPGEKAPPQSLYNVRFDGRELWGDSAEANIALFLDMWESYLEPVVT